MVASAGSSAAIPARAAASCSGDSATQLAGTVIVSPGTATVRIVATGGGGGGGECCVEAGGFAVQASTSPIATREDRIGRHGNPRSRILAHSPVVSFARDLADLTRRRAAAALFGRARDPT